MEKEIVQFDGKELRAGTLLIAEGFEHEHKYILGLIRKYQEDFEELSFLKSKSFKTKGQTGTEFFLAEEQVAFLGTLFRNSKKSVAFKKRLVKEFYRMKNAIIRAKEQHKDTKWIEVRETGKTVRIEATDAIKEFELYAIEQGSQNAKMYYVNITKMMNSLLFIVEGTFKNLRELMTVRQLMTISSAEQIIDKALKDGMKRKMFYKEIYKLVKERVQLFADLHGQSEVISKQISLF